MLPKARLRRFPSPSTESRSTHERDPAAAEGIAGGAALVSLPDAAAAEFLSRGYVGTSVDQIAAGAGIGKSTIHRQFASKEGLFRYVVRAKVHEIAARGFE